MKRNNILMFAYIVFIFLSAFIKQFYDFPMWTKIVVAVTAASWLFAISDCCASISSFQKNIYETEYPLLDTIKYKIRQIKDLMKIKSSEEEITIIKSCEKSCEKLIIDIPKLEKVAKILEKASKLLIFFAFLIFLCIFSFEPVYLFFFARQNGTTVLSFGLILLAQFLTDVGKNQVIKQKKDLEKNIEGLNALFSCYNLEVKHNAD